MKCLLSKLTLSPWIHLDPFDYLGTLASLWVLIELHVGKSEKFSCLKPLEFCLSLLKKEGNDTSEPKRTRADPSGPKLNKADKSRT